MYVSNFFPSTSTRLRVVLRLTVFRPTSAWHHKQPLKGHRWVGGHKQSLKGRVHRWVKLTSNGSMVVTLGANWVLIRVYYGMLGL